MLWSMIKEAINHPNHYGGDTTYEAIKVIEAWQLDFHLGNTVKYISRAGKKDPEKELEDLEKAAWYLSRRIVNLKAQKIENPATDKISENLQSITPKINDRVFYDVPNSDIRKVFNIMAISENGQSVHCQNVYEVSEKVWYPVKDLFFSELPPGTSKQLFQLIDTFREGNSTTHPVKGDYIQEVKNKDTFYYEIIDFVHTLNRSATDYLARTQNGDYAVDYLHYRGQKFNDTDHRIFHFLYP